MAEVVHEVQRGFWKPATVLEPAVQSPLQPAVPEMAEVCDECGTEFMIGARFCHTCGSRRAKLANAASDDAAVIAGWWSHGVEVMRSWLEMLQRRTQAAWREFSLPAWVQYVRFHEIKRRIGLPTAPLIAFVIGLGCVAAAVAVSLFYHPSNLAEFQAIQMWRIQWLLAATASFVAGILLKGSSERR